MPKKRTRLATGTVYWSEPQDRYVGAIDLGRDKNGTRNRKVFVGPRGGNSEDDRLGVKDKLERYAATQRPARGAVTYRSTLSAYLTEWLPSKRRLSEAARANYEWAIEKHIEPALGQMKLHNLDQAKIERFLSDLPLAYGSLQKVRTVLSSALRDAVKSKHIAVNPAAGDILPERKDFTEIAVWSPTEAKRFLRAVKESEHFPLFLLAIVGALGPAELFGVRWKDVDLERGTVAIVANLIEVDGRLSLKETKTKSRRRSVALPQIVLRAMRARHKALDPRPGDHVFTAPEGGPIRRSSFRKRVWRPLIMKARVPQITLYGLRHSSASLMAAMGVPLLVASRALGHSNIKTTANTYTHLFEESQREVASKFDAFLKDL